MKDTEGWKTYFRISKDKELTNDGAQKILQQFSFVLLLFLLFGFFVGTGTGRGVGISGKIKDKALTFEDKLTFADNKTQNVCLLGKNSTYLFYMENDSSDIKITPISGGVLKSFSEAK